MKREIGDYIEDIISAMGKSSEIPPLKPIFEKILKDIEE